ncbi:MAG: cob(I)yrinic acid a,c-diamide adenosyltransferase [Candidatus Micrarchaeota archaeon]|nr:cob(I)yrinic acid a,c-diamide adenosyltransferase [Candidatus Micrarchaeota archaeon]
MTLKKLKRGITEIYYGNSDLVYYPAIGLIIRATGHEFKCLVIQFIPNCVTEILKQLKDVDTYFFNARKSDDITMIITHAIDRMISRDYDIILLDGLLDCLDLIDNETLLELIKKRPFDVELVLTGKTDELPKSIYNSVELITMVTKNDNFPNNS